MKRIPRDPLRFDVFDLFARQAAKQQVSIKTAEAACGFVEMIRASVEASLDNDAMVFGQRTQAMFEALVVSLGAVRLIKREDTADIYADEDLEVPDFRVILADNRQLLVEVKNVFRRDPTDPCELTETYVVALRRYGQIMGCEVKVAIFWAVWNFWTLVGLEAFVNQGTRFVLSFPDALKRTEMALLGDKAIGTQFPLRVRFETDPRKSRALDAHGRAEFTIGGVRLFCADQEIMDPIEQNIAWYCMLYGKWSEDPPEAIMSDGPIEAIEFRFRPEEDNDQGFEIVGWLSAMYSAFYRQATLGEGGVGQVRLEPTPRTLGRLVPDGYVGKALPLWIMVLAPQRRKEERSGDSGELMSGSDPT